MNLPDSKSIPWQQQLPPEKILAIRLQALGDVVITLPYLQSLRNRFPGSRIDFLTRKEVADIPGQLSLFDRVHTIGGGRNFKLQNLFAFFLLPRLLAQRYEVVIDLQNNFLSRWIRKALRPPAWGEFDRFSPLSAGERTRRTIEAVGIGAVEIAPLQLKDDSPGMELLEEAGWQREDPLVVLNPAGYFPTRNWQLENYVEFARLWRTHQAPNTRFLLLGVGSLRERALFLQKQIGDSVINLVGRTSPAEAFAILKKTALVLTEDSGLMHIAWVAGAPTLALFGSSRSDWSAPLGAHSLCLSSADLPCGECMAAECRYGDVHCLSRHTPESVFRKAQQLIRMAVPNDEVT